MKQPNMLKGLLVFLSIFVACPVFAARHVEVVNPPHLGAPSVGFIPSDTSADQCDGYINTANSAASGPLWWQGAEQGRGTYTFVAKWLPNSYTITYKPGTCADIDSIGDNFKTQQVTYDAGYNIYGLDVAGATTENQHTGVVLPVGSTFMGWKIAGDENNTIIYSSDNWPLVYTTDNPWNRTEDLELEAVCSTTCTNVDYPLYDEDEDKCYREVPRTCDPEFNGTVPDGCIYEPVCNCEEPAEERREYEDGTNNGIDDTYDCEITADDIEWLPVDETHGAYDSSSNTCPLLTYTLTYKCDNTTVGETLTYDYGTEVEITDAPYGTPVEGNHHGCFDTSTQIFDDWSCDAGLDDDNNIVMNQNVTCTAQWTEPDTYKITYLPGANCSYGNGITAPVEVEVNAGNPYTIYNAGASTSGVVAPVEYTFAGWKIQGSNNTVDYPAAGLPLNENSWDRESNLTLEGVCNPICPAASAYPNYDPGTGKCYTTVPRGCELSLPTAPDGCAVSANCDCAEPTGDGEIRWKYADGTYNGVADTYSCVKELNEVTITPLSGHAAYDGEMCPLLTLTCPNEYPRYDVETVTDVDTQCYREVEPTCELDLPDVPAHCVVTEEPDCDCEADYVIKEYKNGERNLGETYNTFTCTKTLEDLDLEGESGYTYNSETHTCSLTLTTYCDESTSSPTVESGLVENDTVDMATKLSVCDAGERVFIGWNCGADSGSLNAQSNILTMPGHDVTCVANWENPKVSYYCDTITPDNLLKVNNNDTYDEVSVGQDYTLRPATILNSYGNSCSKDGYESDGWVCKLSSGASDATSYEFSKDFEPWPYESSVDCYVNWKKKYSLTYDCNNNNKGTDGEGTNPEGGQYAAGTPVTLLSYPADCQAPTERQIDPEGWECEGIDQNSGTFDMPSNDVICRAKWKSTAWTITYRGCTCNSYGDPIPGQCQEDLTDKVKSGELETNDKTTYYRTYTSGRDVYFPTQVGTSNYGEIDLPAQAFTGVWFSIKKDVYGNEDYTDVWPIESTRQASQSGDLIVNTCVGDFYRVRYDCKDGDTTDDPQDTAAYRNNNSVVTPPNNSITATCYKPGETFKWNCVDLYTQTSVQSGGIIPGNSFTIHHNTDCEAVWEPQQYTLNFNCDNAGGGIVNQTVSYNLSMNTPVVIANKAPSCSTKIGYGSEYTWSCDGAEPVNGAFDMPDRTVTCTAIWTPNQYDIIYQNDTCEGDGTTLQNTLTYNQVYTHQVRDVGTDSGITVPSGKRFLGWQVTGISSLKKHGDVLGGANVKWTTAGNLVLVAKCDDWACPTDTEAIEGAVINSVADQQTQCYTIEYKGCDKSEPTDPMPDDHCVYNADCSCETGTYRRLLNGQPVAPDVVNNTCTKTYTRTGAQPGYKYDSVTNSCRKEYHVTYKCEADGPDESSTPYWEEDTVQIRNNSNRGDCPANTAIKNFMGWDCDHNVEPGSEQTITSDITCIAQWDALYELRYKCNADDSGWRYGELHVAGETDVPALADNDKASCPTPNGQTFKQWNCSPVTPANSKIATMPSSDVVCVAQWDGDEFKVTYDCSDGHVVGGSATTLEDGSLEYNESSYNFKAVDSVCEYEGHTAADWTCVKQGDAVSGDTSTVPWYTEKVWDVPNDVLCTTTWTPEEYTLTYDCGDNNGLGANDTVTEEYNTEINIRANDDAGTCNVPSDKVFTGWNCDDGINPGQTWNITKNATCTAQWTDEYQVTYDCNGREVKSGVDTVYNITVGDIYTFKGQTDICEQGVAEPLDWECTGNGGTFTIPSGDRKVDSWPAYNVNCVAQWKYNVKYFCDASTQLSLGNANDYDEVIYNKTNYYLRTKTLLTQNENACESSGKEFDKWNCKIGNGSAENHGFTPWKNSDNMECYVVWKNKEYNIKYNVKLNDAIYSTKGGTNSSAISWPSSNPDKYTVADYDITLSKDISHSTRSYTFEGDWYECSDSNKTPVTILPGDVESMPKDLNLCIDMKGWPITYIGCLNGQKTCECKGNNCANIQRDMTGLLKPDGDQYKTYTYTSTSVGAVVFPVVIYPDNNYGFEISATQWPLANRKWYVPSGDSYSRVIDTAKSTGPLVVYTPLKDAYYLDYDCNDDSATWNSAYDPQHETFDKSTNVTVKSANACQLSGKVLKKWNCNGTEYSPNVSLRLTEKSTVCKAVWEDIKYKLTYKCNNGQTPTVYNDLLPNTQVDITTGDKSAPVCSDRNGYERVTEPLWTCTVAIDDNKITMTGDVTCEASWKPELNYYCDDDAGSPINTYHYAVGTTVTTNESVSSCADNNTGRIFTNKWKCNGALYAANTGTFSMPDAPVNCVAQWEYPLRYECDDIDINELVDGGNHVANSSVALNSGACGTPEDKEFDGWEWCKKDGENTPMAGTANSNINSITMPNSGVTCKIKWKLKTCNFEYSVGNCKSGNIANVQRGPISFDAAHSVETFSGLFGTEDIGSEFLYWSDGANQYNSGASITCDASRAENTTLTAVCRGACPTDYQPVNPDADITDIFKQCKKTYPVTCNSTDAALPENCTEATRNDCCADYPTSVDVLYGANSMPQTSYECINEIEKIISAADGFYVEGKQCPQYYNVIYQCEEGENTKTVGGQKTGDSVSISETEPKSAGGLVCPEAQYQFDSWNCSGGSRKGDALTITNGDITCVAQFKHPLNYDCDNDNQEQSDLFGGNYAPGSVTLSSGDICDVPAGKEFDKWDNCVTVRETTIAVNNNSITMPDESVKCTALWKDKEYNIEYNIVTNNAIYSTKGGKNSNLINWKTNQTLKINPDTYTISDYDDVSFVQPSSSTTADYTFEGDWYECVVENGVVTKVVDVTALPGDIENMPKNLKLCIDMKGWPITYIGCLNGQKTCECKGSNCSDVQKDMTGLLRPDGDQYKTYTYTSTSVGAVVFPVVIYPENDYGFAIDSAEWPLANRKWYVPSGDSYSRVIDTAKSTGALVVYTPLKPAYYVEYDCGEDSEWVGEEGGDSVRYEKPQTVVTKGKTVCEAIGGWKFKWQCEGVSALLEPGSGSFTIDSNRRITHCVAQWEPDNYSIKYRGGMAGTRDLTNVQIMPDTSVTYGAENVQLRSNTYQVAGYEFDGWDNCKTEGTAQNVELSVETTGNTTVYKIAEYNYTTNVICNAKWKPLTYDIVYNPGTCAGSVDSVSGVDALTYDDNYNVLGLKALSVGEEDNVNTIESITVPEGSRFIGWYSVLTLTEPDYQPGEYGPWTTTSDLTLYAACEENDYTVEYDCGTESSCGTAPQSAQKHKDDRVVLADANCGKWGSEFAYWECKENIDGGETLDTHDNSWFDMPANNVKCTAKYEEDSYELTYDCDNESALITDEDTYDYAENATARSNACEKTGYEFKNWECVSTRKCLDSTACVDSTKCGTRTVVAGAEFGVYDDTKCTAVWEPETYDIVYDNGNCWPDAAQQPGVMYTDTDALVYDESFDFAGIKTANGANVHVQPGYEFVGWSKTQNATEDNIGDYVSDLSKWTKEEGLTLYAVCRRATCKIIYDHGAVEQGRFNPDDFVEGQKPLDEYTIETQPQMLDRSVSKGYYVFDGWYDNPEKTGTAIETFVPTNYLDSTLPDGSCGVTLYAKWLNAGAILYDCDANDSLSKKLTRKEPYNTPVNAPREDYCDLGDNCAVEQWVCENNESYDPLAQMYIPNSQMTLKCDAQIICNYPIHYTVFEFNYDAENVGAMPSVYVGNTLYNVSDLEPDSYVTGGNVVYPEISYPNCTFEGWFDNAELKGTPVLGIYRDPDYNMAINGINVYGKMICGNYNIEYHNIVAGNNGNNPTTYVVSSEFDLNAPQRNHYMFKGWHVGSLNGNKITHVSGAQYRGTLKLFAEWEFVCNEGGQPHWLHIGDGINDRVCLYDEPPAGTVGPYVRVKRTRPGQPPYYVVLSEDPEVVIHENSIKRMRIDHDVRNKTYNICDMSSCPPGGQDELVP